MTIGPLLLTGWWRFERSKRSVQHFHCRRGCLLEHKTENRRYLNIASILLREVYITIAIACNL